MRIYWELHEIPRPTNSYVGKTDGRVYILANPNLPFDKNKRIIIGRASGKFNMYPNDNFKFRFPALWEEYYGTKVKHHVINSGMYALTLGIGYRNFLYPLLVDAIGEYYANFIMDFSMYSIQNKSNVALNFQDAMEKQVCFSKKAFSGTKISDVLKNDINENQTMNFRNIWMDKCSERGVKKVWISIDGSNNDCNAKKCKIAKIGHAKSNNNNPVVSYMYAVNAEDGMPITYIEYEGNTVDCKAFMKIINMLDNHNIGVEGFILDRGFATSSVLELLKELDYQYIIMLKSNSLGNKEMVEKYGTNIQWEGKYVLNGDLLCGHTEEQQIFANSKEKAFINLYYDSFNALSRTKTLFTKLFDMKVEIEANLVNGKETIIPKQFTDCFIIDYTNKTVEFDNDQLTKCRHSKGLASIASSLNLGASKVNDIYHLRDSSETQFNMIKTQLGNYVSRTHTTESIRNKFFIGFISAIIRNEISKVCIRVKYDTTPLIQTISSIEMLLDKNDNYLAIHNESAKAKKILNLFGIATEDFDIIATDVNARATDPTISQVRVKPKHPEKRKRGNPRTKKVKDSTQPKRKPGRPKGSKNKNQKKVIALDSTQPKKKPGRPKGSKNKNQKKEIALDSTLTKKKPGRPKGSKNKVKNSS